MKRKVIFIILAAILAINLISLLIILNAELQPDVQSQPLLSYSLKDYGDFKNFYAEFVDEKTGISITDDYRQVCLELFEVEDNNPGFLCSESGFKVSMDGWSVTAGAEGGKVILTTGGMTYSIDFETMEVTTK